MHPRVTPLLRRWSAALSAAALLLAGCGGGQTRGTAIDPALEADHGASLAALVAQHGPLTPPAGADVAVGVIKARTILGVPLDGGAPWRFKHPLDSRPAIAGGVVVGQGAGELFALSARTGKLLWKRAAGGMLRGAGDDGSTTVISLQSTTGTGSIVLAVARDGSVVRQIEDQEAIGVPAVAAGYALLPWGRFVSVYDLVSGEEKARIEGGGDASRVFALGGALFFGEGRLSRVDAPDPIALPSLPMPDAPRWMRPGTEVLPPRATAEDEVSIYARPTAAGPLGIAGDHMALVHHRIVIGLGARTGAVAWARVAGLPILGGAAYDGGFALCDAAGKVTFYEAAQGAPAGEVSLGSDVDACVVQADRLRRKPTGAAPRPLARQLLEAIRADARDAVSAQVFLLRELGELPGDEVTEALVTMAGGDFDGPALLVEEARKQLAQRHGDAAMLRLSCKPPPKL
jgi:outer membrane protein assembly factor BamB